MYSLATLRRHYRVFDEAFGHVPHLVCFSVKANSNLAVLRAFAREGSGFDIVSGGELFRALAAGADPSRSSSPASARQRTRSARRSRPASSCSTSSRQPSSTCSTTVAGRLGKRAPHRAARQSRTSTRKTHPYIATGLKKSKFGIAHRTRPRGSTDGPQRCRTSRSSASTATSARSSRRWRRSSTRWRAVRDAARRAAARGLRHPLSRHRRRARHHATTTRSRPTPGEYAEAITRALRGLDVTLILEPGRVIVGNAGILLTRVLYLKETDEQELRRRRRGMNDLIRPSLYGSYQEIRPVRPREGAGDRRPTSSGRSARAATSSRKDRDAAGARAPATCSR